MKARDEGSGTVLTLAVVAVVLVAAVAAAALFQASGARHRAQTAADLAALAAAQARLDGQDSACERAARVVQANGARLISCEIGGDEAVVVTQQNLAGLLAHVGPATARAHAGPGR